MLKVGPRRGGLSEELPRRGSGYLEIAGGRCQDQQPVVGYVGGPDCNPSVVGVLPTERIPNGHHWSESSVPSHRWPTETYAYGSLRAVKAFYIRGGHADKYNALRRHSRTLEL